ncbi:D-aminoacyl-tRNA deacylase [Garciella nitratireducens]|uniref:D-aminoacyl-tRNA deacylase n=1 Tax=Garciella nitratireducens DSM 15102 TaxID=1121911 RepID=A0A1T4K0Y5_9FIRM|nr:D-aminoacyl-tRNA deacylase [Garciella nitratireducens]SJZ36110.1 D-tyrosyl-tRNA(Tyr) deacylase [Garciella nitratireducens DSM 15102]
MRAVIQRVNFSNVQINNVEIGKINKGLLVFLGIKDNDTEKDVLYLADKIVHLRIFEDQGGKMNLSLKDINGEILVISQFTLYGDCKKGRRPNFMKAAKPEQANLFYERFIEEMKKIGIRTQTGRFQSHMMVNLQNDGPVTILIDSEKQF